MKSKCNKPITWNKIKNILKMNKVEKIQYKQKIGYSTVSKNKALFNEYIIWVDIYNNYKTRLELFYKQIKTYKNILNEININIDEIKKKTQLSIADHIFSNCLGTTVYEYSGLYEYKEIRRIVFNLVDVMFCELLINEFREEYKFQPFVTDLEITERNVSNHNYVMNIMYSENIYFENEIEKFKDLLDRMTDLCENTSILDKNRLMELRDYLETHQNYLAKNINVISIN